MKIIRYHNGKDSGKIVIETVKSCTAFPSGDGFLHDVPTHAPNGGRKLTRAERIVILGCKSGCSSIQRLRKNVWERIY
jgi:hypothetical protein